MTDVTLTEAESARLHAAMRAWARDLNLHRETVPEVVDAIVAARLAPYQEAHARVPVCPHHHGMYPDTCWHCGLNRLDPDPQEAP